MDLKEMRELRGETYKQIAEMQTLNAGGEHEWSAEDEERWTKLNADYDERTIQIEKAERAEKLAAEQIEPIHPEDRQNDSEPEQRDYERVDQRQWPAEEDRALALQAWARVGQGIPLDDTHYQAAELCGINLASRVVDIPLSRNDEFRKVQREYRALSAVTGTAGAFTIPEGFIPRLEIALLTYGAMMSVGEIITTSKGEDLPWPTTDDTSNTGVQIGENTAVSEQDVTFGAMVLQAWQYSSKMVKVPFVLLQDSAFNLANVLGDMLGERLGRILNEKFTTGTGAATPYGIVNAATLGITASAATDPTTQYEWSEITDLIHAIDPSYRPGSRFMFHDNETLYIRKMVDGEGRPLWQADPNGVAPATLQGYPYTVNQQMSSTRTTGDIVVLFGQFAKYKIRMVGSLRLRRLEERYAEYDQIAFLAYMRADGNLLDAGTNPVKYLQMA